jgi:uncharacterized delta-60 repeat protein
MYELQEGRVAAAYAVALQPDGKIVVAGAAGPAFVGSYDYGGGGQFYPIVSGSDARSAVVRLNSDGSLDTTYGSGGKQVHDFGGGEDPGGTGEYFAALAIQPDGNAVLAGTTYHAPTGWSILTARDLGGNFEVSNQDEVDSVLAAVNAIPPSATPENVTLDLRGGTYSTNGVVVHPPDNVTFVVQNGTLDPSYPALTVAGGHVIVRNCTLLTTGDAPTILVSGGQLTLRNDVIQESTGYADAALWVTGGSADLGSAADPGHDTLNVNGAGTLVRNDTAAPVPALGNTWQVNGSAPASPAALVAGPVDWIIYAVQVLTDVSDPLHAGRTIPIKVELLGASGNDVSAADIAVTALQLERVNADGTQTQVALQGTGGSNPQDLFRYDATLGGYIFNLSTRGLAAGTYELDWTADGDPTVHVLRFQVV